MIKRKNGFNSQSKRVTKGTQRMSQFTKWTACLCREKFCLEAFKLQSQSTPLQRQNSASWGKMFLLDREQFKSFPPSWKEWKCTVETSSMNQNLWPGCSVCTAAALPRPCTALLPLPLQLVVEEQKKVKLFQPARTTPRVSQSWPHCRWEADRNSESESRWRKTFDKYNLP